MVTGRVSPRSPAASSHHADQERGHASIYGLFGLFCRDRGPPASSAYRGWTAVGTGLGLAGRVSDEPPSAPAALEHTGQFVLDCDGGPLHPCWDATLLATQLQLELDLGPHLGVDDRLPRAE